MPVTGPEAGPGRAETAAAVASTTAILGTAAVMDTMSLGTAADITARGNMRSVILDPGSGG